MICSANALRQFQQYIDAIEQLAEGHKVLSPIEWRHKMVTCLDGEPGQVLRREVEYTRLRQQGAYFTGARMATRVANALGVDLEGKNRTDDGIGLNSVFPPHPDSGHLYFDPTCGAGDLLLAVARKLPIAGTLGRTLADWGRCLGGCDISPDFVRLAKARLVLLAAKRCRVRPSDESVVLSRTFPKIVEADFLSHPSRAQHADVVIMNPPFGYTRAPNGCEWAQGRINAAAMFTERAILDSREGTRIAAILPDVLRSGSRYERWRNMLGALGSIRCERPLGLFDQWADVDVYLLDFLKAADSLRRGKAAIQPSGIQPGGVGRRFAVHVGPVVPHRHKEVGPDVHYIHARSLPAWGEYKHIREKRKFSGRLFQPPFVAVRRTSSPDDRKRAVATLVLSEKAVAVENHLIVLLPRDATTRTCRDLMLRLQSTKTDDWINSRMRCRHLTTAVLAGMPWWYKP